MKTKFLLSVVTASLLLSSVSLFASSYNDSVAKKEEKALLSSKVNHSKDAKAKVEELGFKEAFLAKAKRGEFQKEASMDEAKRIGNIIDKEVKNHKNSLKKAPKEFMEGLNDTIIAVHSINENKIDKAKSKLKEAQKKLQHALKENPDLKLIPVADNAEIISFNGDAKLIQQIKDTVAKLLKDNNTQLAIDMLEPLQDEIILKTQLVPSYIYPKAIEVALKNLEDGKNALASQTLIGALNATQIDTVIIPIPLVTAQDMVLEASKLKKSNKKDILKLLNAAQKELQRAVLLGYTYKNAKSYKDIDKQIEILKSEVKGKNKVEQLYEKLLSSFKHLR